MKSMLTFFLFIFSIPAIFSQQSLKVTNERGNVIPFAALHFPNKLYFTNLQGEYVLPEDQVQKEFTISHPEYSSRTLTVSSHDFYIQVRLQEKSISNSDNSVPTKNTDAIIERAIRAKPHNDPELTLVSFQHSSYNKLVIDKGPPGSPYFDSGNSVTTTYSGRRFLSENVSLQKFKKLQGRKKVVEGISTAGLKMPAYNILGMDLELPSVYKKEYPIFYTRYAGPLAEGAFKNYSYDILDTLTNQNRPAYIIYFKPKRPKLVPSLEGIFLLDTASLAVQYAKFGYSGEILVEAEHQFQYFEEEDLWFPKKQNLLIKPGTGGKDISIFSGSIAFGTIQKEFSVLDLLLSPGQIEENLFLNSTTVNYNIQLKSPVNITKNSAVIEVEDRAADQINEFWDANRQITFTDRDEVAESQLTRIVADEEIVRKIEVAKGISSGYYPLGFWNLDLSRLIAYNKYEGFKMGAGGETNSTFSENIKLNGYAVYGFKDRRLKYGFGTGFLLHRRTGSRLNFMYRNDIREVASFPYIQREKEFVLLQPRRVNITTYFAHEDLEVSLQHRVAPSLNTEVQLERSDISQLTDYAFYHDNQLFTNYTISGARLSFLWRPFSKFISTPESFRLYRREYPVITGQLMKSIPDIFGGDFSFTRLGLKAEYKLQNLDKSSTHFIVEGNAAYGDLPLTHAFHAQPNNANQPGIFKRFAIAGETAFETMYFNEFYSDRQAAFHLRHQFRPMYISEFFQPQIVVISRHVIGDFRNIDAHRNVDFRTLEHGFSEAAVEVNQLFLGLGLSAAYRYGAYHLPDFSQNFSLKFTLSFQL